MDLGLDGRTALVTGASKGIGKAIAGTLLAEGCHVHMVSRSLGNLRAAATELGGGDNRVILHALDVALGATVDRLLSAVGTPDILINNAGAIPAGDLAAMDDARWRDSWELKMFGYINMTRAFYAAMVARGSGVIINVTGLAGQKMNAGYIAGSTANAGLDAFSRALGGASLHDGVRVLAVSPGAVHTERMETMMRDRAQTQFGDAERWPELTANLPGGRPGRVQEVADTVAFLASDRAGYISGTVVTVDGGHGAAP